MAGKTEWKTVKVPEEDHEQASDHKPDDATWGDCLVAGAERLNDNLDSDPPAGIDLNALEPGVPSAEEIAAEVDGSVDERTLAEYVADYLVSEFDLPRKVAEEVRG